MKKLLNCPKCREVLEQENNSLKCCNGHVYDIAKQGYVNLTLGSTAGGGDSKEMCRSRHEFHNADYYSCLSDKLAELCIEMNLKSIVDAGCGEGYYLRKIKERCLSAGASLEALCGIDLAKEAVAIAAKCEKQREVQQRIEYAVAGIFDMPLPDGCADCVLSVFAPVPHIECLRILKTGGALIVVSPGANHLKGLKKAVYENIYLNDELPKEYDGFEKAAVHTARDTITVLGDNIRNLFQMTPYYWKTSESDAKKLEGLTELTTEIDFIITIYKKI